MDNKHKLSLFDFLWEYKLKLSLGIFAVFFICYTFIASLGLLPESLQPAPDTNALVQSLQVTAVPLPSIAQASSSPVSAVPVAATTSPVKKASAPKATAAAPVAAVPGENPIRIVIPAIGVDAHISNPKSSSLSVLDADLQTGAVRYPGSAGLGGGNTYIFGHSTNHPVVVNQAYKTFNKFSDLVAGDIVTVYSIDRVYTYKVENVRLAVDSDIYVSFSTSDVMLTLSTCDTFAAKADRWVVQAAFVGSQPLTDESI